MPDTPRHHARLCPIVQGVTFDFACLGRTVRVLLPSDTLESVFGAAPQGSAWISTFLRLQALIVATARGRFESCFEEPLVLRPEHFAALQLPVVLRPPPAPQRQAVREVHEAHESCEAHEAHEALR
jgi:hypothetical protein